jgi:hypothetical protein
VWIYDCLRGVRTLRGELRSSSVMGTENAKVYLAPTTSGDKMDAKFDAFAREYPIGY